MRFVLLLAFALLASACGSILPTSPSPFTPPGTHVAGSWTGTIESSSVNDLVFIAFSQSGGAVTGKWATQSVRGTINGIIDRSTFSGSATFSGQSATGRSCDGSGAFSGTIATTSFTLQSTGFTGDCAELPKTVRFVVQRLQ